MLRTLLSFRGDRRGLIEATALQDSARVWLRHSAAIAAASLKQLIVLGVAIVNERSFRGDRRGLIEAMMVESLRIVGETRVIPRRSPRPH